MANIEQILSNASAATIPGCGTEKLEQTQMFYSRLKVNRYEIIMVMLIHKRRGQP